MTYQQIMRSCNGSKFKGQSANRFWLLLHTNLQTWLSDSLSDSLPRERSLTNGWLKHRPTREKFRKQIAEGVCHWKWHETAEPAHNWTNKNNGILKSPYRPDLYKQRTQDCSIRHHSYNAERPQLSFLRGERRRPKTSTKEIWTSVIREW